MKKSLFFLVFLLPLICNSQTFNGPESVEYDSLYGRWLVGQNGSGQVLQLNPANNALTLFCSGMSSGPYGIEILDSVLYCCDGSFIKGYHLATGAQVFNLNLNASFLNGITSDGISNLFATDFSAKRIYRINTISGTFNLMTTTVKTPNGIYYDGAQNRCVFVTWGSAASFQAMSLADSTISNLYTSTYSSFDGLTRDLQGNWYASSWGNSSLIRFDSSFTGTPTIVKTGLSSPADLDLNAAGDSIGIPNSGNANNVVFYPVPSVNTGIQDDQPEEKVLVYPNPASNIIFIELKDPISNGQLNIIDANGKLVLSRKINGQKISFHKNTLSNGKYFMSITDVSGKILLSRFIIFE
ncbi:hypothetical protein BH11BAC2_BH11BAC2_22500 [soil metagenome]